MTSPYAGLPPSKWERKTRDLLRKHPLKSAEIVEVALDAWEAIFKSRIGKYRIGRQIFPKPQFIGFFLHELIALEFATRHPEVWRGEQNPREKDLVCLTNDFYSTEIKTSSHRSQIWGNRSYAQKEADPKKTKSGFYITVNFEGFSKSNLRPCIRRIRFGWIDHTDWIGQSAPTGQRARLKPESDRAKLLVIYDVQGSMRTGEDLYDLTEDEDAFGAD